MSTITRRPQPLAKPPKKPALPKEVTQLERNKKATVTKNADGSVTRRRDTAKTSKQVTVRESKYGEKTVEYSKRQSTRRGDSESSFTAHTDLLGRTKTKHVIDSTNTKGVNTLTERSTDVYGIAKEGKTVSKQVERGNTRESSVKSTVRDSVGNRRTASDVTKVTTGDKTVTTTTEKRAAGSELTTASEATFKDGKFTFHAGADFQKGKSVEKSSLRETEYDPTKILEKYDKYSNFAGKVFKFLGLEETWQKELAPELMKERELLAGRYGSVVAQYGVSGGQRLSIDGEGVRADFTREARAGVYAQSQGGVEGRFGTASYAARAHAEAVARIDARGKIDANGLDATVNARVGVSVEAEVRGQARTQAIRFGGVDLYAGVEGRARAVAEASAEATGTVRVTRNPPTAIAQGTAGASAVAKVEGDIRASAGPFSVVATGYASAGAEARASGIIGFEDGKLKIGGSVGAALGVGLGGGVTVEVDVKQIGDMAHKAADVNGDGKLGLDDAALAVTKTARRVASWFGF